MGIWNSICTWFGTSTDVTDVTDIGGGSCHSIESSFDCHSINPATSLPMIGDGCGGVDVGGSPFGVDIHDDDWSTSSSWDDTLPSGIGSSWDD